MTTRPDNRLADAINELSRARTLKGARSEELMTDHIIPAVQVAPARELLYGFSRDAVSRRGFLGIASQRYGSIVILTL